MKIKDPERHPIKAVIVGLIYFVLLVVVAFISISMITSSFPDFEYIFDDITRNIIIFGTFVAILAAVTAYFDKGEIYRMISGIGKTGFMAIYIFTSLTGLDISVEIEQVTAEIAIPGIILLMMAMMVMKAGYFPLEYYLYGIRDEKKEREEIPFL